MKIYLIVEQDPHDCESRPVIVKAFRRREKALDCVRNHPISEQFPVDRSQFSIKTREIIPEREWDILVRDNRVAEENPDCPELGEYLVETYHLYLKELEVEN